MILLPFNIPMSNTMPKRKREEFQAPTVGEVREFLNKYDAEQPFFIRDVQDDDSDTRIRDVQDDDSNTRSSDIEFYQRIYETLRPQFTRNRNTSTTNSDKIKQMTGDGLDNISSKFELWGQNPQSFWEAEAKTLPGYSSLNRNERLAGFITRAVCLEPEAEIQQVQRRFIALSAYELFIKVVPTSKKTITEASVRNFLGRITLLNPSTDETLKTCVAIIQRGQKCSALCRALSPPKADWIEYGILLDSELPDHLFDSRDRLSGEPRKAAIDHLKKLWRPSCVDLAHKTARILLDYNEKVCWIENNEEQASSKSLPTSSLINFGQETSSSEQRQPGDTERLHALAAAAEVSRPTTQQAPNSNDSDTSDITSNRNGTSNSPSAASDASQLMQSPGQHVDGCDKTEKQVGGAVDNFTESQSFSDFLRNDKDFDLNDGSTLDLDKIFNDWRWWSESLQD